MTLCTSVSIHTCSEFNVLNIEIVQIVEELITQLPPSPDHDIEASGDVHATDPLL